MTLGEHFDHLNDQLYIPLKPSLPFVRTTDVHSLTIEELKKYTREKEVYVEAMERYKAEHSVAVQQALELKQQFKEDLFKSYPVWKKDQRVVDGIYYKVLTMHLPTYREFEQAFKQEVLQYNNIMEGVD